MPGLRLVYFENKRGELQAAPTADTPTPHFFRRKECHYIGEVREFEKRYEQQELRKAEAQAEREYNANYETRKRVRRNIMSAIESSCTDQYSKDFLREWCQLRDELRDKYQASFRAREIMLEAANYDKPRSADDILSGKMS